MPSLEDKLVVIFGEWKDITDAIHQDIIDHENTASRYIHDTVHKRAELSQIFHTICKDYFGILCIKIDEWTDDIELP